MNQPIGLFEAYGIEIELMIVDSKALDVSPTADQLLTSAAGELVSDFEDGDITWSNELVSHVIEFKTTGPAPSLETLEASFLRSQKHAQELLKQQGRRLMPTGMHPWMNPETETVLWPHDNNEIYSLYDRIFDCRGHGWSNLQSVHINLPFANEAEFVRLHSVVRALLPIIPALGASTPICDGARTGLKDTRLAHYETNQKSVPIIAGDVIPEPVRSYADYRQKISTPIQLAIRPHDPDGLLEGDWLNSRAAIARIDRGTIEIRLLDTQECAHANLAIVQLIVATIQALINDADFRIRADELDTKAMHAIWKSCVSDAENAVIEDPRYLSALIETPTGEPSEGYTTSYNNARMTAHDVWRTLFESRVKPYILNRSQSVQSLPSDLITTFESLLERPSLATRIEIAAGEQPTRERLYQIYETLCDCLDKNEVFVPESVKTTETNHGAQKTKKLPKESASPLSHL